MKQITNRYKRYTSGEWSKHPRANLAKVRNKKIKKLDLDTVSVRYSKRLRREKSALQGFCPFCGDRVISLSLRNETGQSGACKKCHAVKCHDQHCPCCKSGDVWKKEKIYKCNQCGKVVFKREAIS